MLPKFPGSKPQQFSLWPLRSAPGSLGTYGFLTPPYGLPYGLELKNNPRLCTSLRVYGSNTPQEAAILILGALPHKCGVPVSLGTPHLCGSEASKRELPGSESQNDNCCRKSAPTIVGGYRGYRISSGGGIGGRFPLEDRRDKSRAMGRLERVP